MRAGNGDDDEGESGDGGGSDETASTKVGGSGEERVECGDEEGETPNASEGGDLKEGEVAAGGVAGEVPGEADDGEMGAGVFEGDPEEGREDESGGTRGKGGDDASCTGAGGASCGTGKESDAARKNHEDDSAGNADEGEDSGGVEWIHVAVLAHDYVDPGEAGRVEKEAVEEAVERRFFGGGVEGGNDQESDADPSEHGEVVIGKREAEKNAGGAG